MINKAAAFINMGMNRDISISKAPNEFAYTNYNIRITELEHDSLLSVTNEKGTKDAELTFDGLVLGYCVLNEHIVMFCWSKDQDYIYDIILDETASKLLSLTTLYHGHLNFSPSHPIETLGLFETENVQKIYWVDGVNQPRVINIKSVKFPEGDDTQFDFLVTVNNVNGTVLEVEKTFASYGNFPSGTIQYSFTYSNDFGQESAIVYTSPIYYLTDEVKGAGEDELTHGSFKVTIKHPDTRFDYVNIYSFIRTSTDKEGQAKLVASVKINEAGDDISIVDTNSIYSESISPTDLLYKGGELVSAYTIDQKDNTLFLGNLSLTKDTWARDNADNIRWATEITTKYRLIDYTVEEDAAFPHWFTLNGPNVSYPRCGNYYRIGIQFKDKYSKWTEPVFLKDVQMDKRPFISGGDDKIYVPEFVAKLNDGLLSEVREHYLAARLLVVLPDEGSRNIIGQGVVNSTVFNCRDRADGVSFAESSWFFRPIPYFNPDGGTLNQTQAVSQIAWQNYRKINSAKFSTGEIRSQSNCKDDRQWWIDRDDLADDVTYEDNLTLDDDKSDDYVVDGTIVTFNSPDIDLATWDEMKADFSIVGYAGLAKRSHNSMASMLDAGTNIIGARFTRVDKIASKERLYNFFFNDNETTYTNYYDFYDHKDQIPDEITPDQLQEAACYNFTVYPWNSESLNATTGDTRTGTYRSKVFARYLYFDQVQYLDNPWRPRAGIRPIKVYDSAGSDIIVLNRPKNAKIMDKYAQLLYKGSVNNVVSSSQEDKKYVVYGNRNDKFLRYIYTGHKIGEADLTTNPVDLGIEEHNWYPVGYWMIDGESTKSDPPTIMDPIQIKYKSTDHAVIVFDWEENNGPVSLPVMNTMTERDIRGDIFWKKPFFMNDDPLVPDVAIPGGGHIGGEYFRDTVLVPPGIKEFDQILWIGELTRETTEETRFGGNSEFALKHNIWLPFSQETSLVDDDPALGGTIQSMGGDTYYQRYDVLKTYPYSNDDNQSVVEIGSFMLESYKNLNGRYDNNIGKADNTYMTPENFNLINDSYTQADDFFNYAYLDERDLMNTGFPNQFTWSLTKHMGEYIDSWTRINMASVYSVDGDKGPINSISRYANTLIGFQDTGIFEILFNTRTQIAATNGVPIEIANSGKVDGVRYLSNNQGCLNKWSICETATGLYFIDDINHCISRFAGQGVDNLSSRLGFDKWLDGKCSNKAWEPKYFSNCRTHYDKNYNDIYFTYDDSCLIFSEKLQQFMTFASYDNTGVMTNVKDKFLAFKVRPTDEPSTDSWYVHEGPYSSFFGYDRDYYIEYRLSQDPMFDKTFTTIEWTADMVDTDKYKKESPWDATLPETFDTLEIRNEYQRGISDLTYRNAMTPFNMQRKYRIWRANIPRDREGLKEKGMTTLDRIRSQWATFKLTKKASENNRNRLHEIHNLVVRYTMQ